MLDDLRHRHHQPHGGGLLGHDGAEIDRLRLHPVQRLVDRRQQHPAARRGPAGGSASPSRTRTALCSCAAFSRTCVCAKARP